MPPTRPARAVDTLGDLITHATVAGLVGLGVRLGLYEAMAGRGPLTAAEVATAAGLDERWVREWCYGQAAAGVLAHAPLGPPAGGERFELTGEMAALLADPSAVEFMGAHFTGLPGGPAGLPRVEEAFRTGVGASFDDRGAEGAEDTEALFANWYRHRPAPAGIAALDGVAERLEAGLRVADVGCGSGVALLALAAAYPAGEYHGFDPSGHAVARAERHRADAGAANVAFHRAGAEGLAAHGPYGLVTTFDCLHDLPQPDDAVAAIAANLEPEGTWMVADIACAEGFEANLARPRLAAMLYATSVYSCLPSGRSEPDGAGLGTCGLPAPALERLGRRHGFSRFRRLDIDHPVNAFYELRR